ncbi:hypothetical protein GCM10023340_09550 [Nocardioides marinquilinus]|uniref:Sensor protein KdpD transmembrane domain-containing protein n=1 Tax=Nocardioides marinquilinus TaxID=1210400 RepID=A0ABP9PBD7_9ACTN
MSTPPWATGATGRTPSARLLGVAGLLAPPAVAGLLYLVRDRVSEVNAVLVLGLVVVAVAAGGSRVAGVLTAVSSAAWFEFFFLPPRLTFAIDRSDDVETAVLLVLVGLAVTEIVLWGRRQQAAASRHEGYLGGIVSAAGMVADGAATPQEGVAFVAAQVREVLGVDDCTWAEGAPGGGRPRLERDGSVTRDGGRLDVDRSGLPTNDVVELPVARHGVVLGRFVLAAATRTAWPTLEQRLVAVALADQAAAALTPLSAGPPPRAPGGWPRTPRGHG